MFPTDVTIVGHVTGGGGGGCHAQFYLVTLLLHTELLNFKLLLKMHSEACFSSLALGYWATPPFTVMLDKLCTVVLK